MTIEDFPTTPETIFKINVLEPFPPGADPLYEDYENMGTSLGENVMVLHKSFPGDKMCWMILVHIPSGQRIMITFPEEKERLLSFKEATERLNDI